MTDTVRDLLHLAIRSHRNGVRQEWQVAHRDDPEYGDIVHVCAPDCTDAILATPEGQRLTVKDPEQCLCRCGDEVLRDDHRCATCQMTDAMDPEQERLAAIGAAVERLEAASIGWHIWRGPSGSYYVQLGAEPGPGGRSSLPDAIDAALGDDT